MLAGGCWFDEALNGLTCFSLSLASLGAKRASSMWAGFSEYTLPRQPALAFEEVAALLQAFKKGVKNKALSSHSPPLSLVMALPSSLQ